MIPDNNILDLLLSLTLIYALLSILVSILLEWWNHYRKSRGKLLKTSIVKLLNDQLNYDYGDLLYNHYLISGLKSDGRPPQYISSTMFAEALIDTVATQVMHCREVKLKAITDGGKQYEMAGSPPPADVLSRYKSALESMKPSPLRDVLQSFWDKSDGDYNKLKLMIETWYNDYMDRVSGWYKTKQQWKLLFFGFAVAIGLNVDSLHLIKVISMDDRLRSNLVSTAERVADNYSATADSLRNDPQQQLKMFQNAVMDSTKQDTTGRGIDSVHRKIEVIIDVNKYRQVLQLNDSVSNAYMARADSVLGIAAALDLPLGWSENSAPLSWWNCGCKETPQCNCTAPKSKGIVAYNEHRDRCVSFTNILLYLAGILITTISLSFGAPFWFQVLVKLVNIRRAGKKPSNQP